MAGGTTDDELGCVDLTHVKSNYGFSHMVGHRSSLANALYKGCKREQGIKFFFSTTASNIREFDSKPQFTATPRNGGVPFVVETDILLGCDGIKSVVRVQLLKELGVTAQVEDSGQAAYRIMLKREEIAHDPELMTLLDADQVTRWIGERRHIIAYPVSSKEIYNISTAQPDVNFAAGPSATYTTKGSKRALLSVYADFCPKLRRMLQLVPEGDVCEWKLRVHSPLPTWVLGSVALVGDACHPSLPHLAQGAAQAIEDAIVLGVVLSRLPDTSKSSINKSLQVYETVRKKRAETLVDLAAQSGRVLHLGEGMAKEERDRQFAALRSGKGPVPDKWADAEVQMLIYGFDAAKVANDVLDASTG